MVGTVEVQKRFESGCPEGFGKWRSRRGLVSADPEGI